MRTSGDQALLDAQRRAAHDLVDERERLVERIHVIDAQLRKMDGRALAGAPSLWSTDEEP